MDLRPHPFLSTAPQDGGAPNTPSVAPRAQQGWVQTYPSRACGSRGQGLAAPLAGLGQKVHLEDRESIWLQKLLAFQLKYFTLQVCKEHFPANNGNACVLLPFKGDWCYFYLLNQKIKDPLSNNPTSAHLEDGKHQFLA